MCDMAGNVREWTADQWHHAYDVTGDNISDAPDDGTAWREDEIADTVARGGSFGHGPYDLRTTYRDNLTPDTEDLMTGFRCVRDVIIISGEVKRDVNLTAGGDGWGTLCIALLDTCPKPDQQEVTDYSHAEIYSIDVSDMGRPFFFEMSVPFAHLTGGEDDFKLPRSDFGVLIERFVEISEAEEHDGIGILPLYPEVLLSDRRGALAHSKPILLKIEG